MSILIEIEAAVEALPRDQKEQLLLFLAAQLRGAEPPPPRDFSLEEINAWIADDELIDADKATLDAALTDYEKNPNAGSSWDEVKARIQSKLRS